MIDVSIIIVNYNTLELTLKCIDSIFEWTSGLEFEVILVDNNSTDGSCEYFKRDRRVFFIDNDVNYGFGIANNIGYNYAKGKYIFLLNSDTVLLNNAVKIFYDYSENNHIQISGSLLLNSNLEIIHSYGYFYDINYEIVRLFNKFFRRKYVSDMKIELPISVDWITGADLFIKNTLIQDVGLFDSHFFMYGEDVDFQYRIDKLNIPRYIIDGPRIIHYVGGSNADNNDFNMKSIVNFFYSVFLLKRKYYNYFHYLLYRFAIILYLLPKIVRSFSRKKNLIDIKYLFIPITKHPNYILGDKLSF